ncbi:MAG: ScyD/ScyE family protein [Nocardioidaceae bacterium]
MVTKLNGPRGLAVAGGRVYFSQADGSISRVRDSARRPGRVRSRGTVPEQFLAPAIARNESGDTYAVTVGAMPDGKGAATVFKKRRGAWVRIADLAAFQAEHPDPDDQADEDAGDHSNPFGIAALDRGGALVADAEGNELLRVSDDGDVTSVARIRPRRVKQPGTDKRILSEAVATSVTIGDDGYWYVGELRGFPATPGTSQVWRIKPGTENAVCRPRHPDRGPCTRFADGFTSIVDLAAGNHGRIYVLELAKIGWLAAGEKGADQTGSLFEVSPGGRERHELVPGQLKAPGGVEVGDGRIWVTGPISGKGSLSAVRHRHR